MLPESQRKLSGPLPGGCLVRVKESELVSKQVVIIGAIVDDEITAPDDPIAFSQNIVLPGCTRN